MQDKVAKDRQAKGSRNGRSKLDEKQVRTIKQTLLFDYCSKAALARQFNVSSSVIRDIYNRKTWKRVDTFDFDDLFVNR